MAGHTTHQPDGSRSILRKATAEDLFNLPLYEHHLIIDTRPTEEYSLGHIATAVSYPSPSVDIPEKEREKSLIRFIKDYVKEFLRPENPSPIVVYGNDSPESLFHAEWLARKLEKLQNDRKIISRIDETDQNTDIQDQEDQPFNHLEHFCLTIADRAHEIWILEGGYETFHAEYDFLCGNIDFSAMFPLPHRISPHLFLGTRVVPLTKEVLSGKLRITHIIVSEYQKLDWQELEGLITLKCSVREINSQDMFPCWTACNQFINEATAANGRVLVMLFGRSRSTSVTIAYLIKSLKMSFDEAWKFVGKKCWHLIDKSLVYEDQLRRWEKTELAAIDVS